MTPDRCAGCGAPGGGARCRWSGARGGDTGSALIFTLLGEAAGGGVPPPSTGKLLLWTNQTVSTIDLDTGFCHVAILCN